jgi:hypothetical protein
MIQEKLKEIPKFNEALNFLFENKSQKSIFNKAAEEAGELLVRLLQKINKKEEKINPNKILEEMVDVQINLILLEKYFTKEQIEAMVKEKAEKFLSQKKIMELYEGI